MYLKVLARKCWPVSADLITKIRPFKYMYIENFRTKNWKFLDTKILIFFIFRLKT